MSARDCFLIFSPFLFGVAFWGAVHVALHVSDNWRQR